MKKWLPILVLAAAQFVMVLDTTVMNVAISDVVADLDTTVSQVQLAITLYTLVMAGLMLTGGKLGDILGRRRTFAIGMVVYAAGSLTTALSPNATVLILGWSGLEGIGAAMVIPAIASLTARNYSGSDRALAYGIIGGIAAAGVAAGPLIGGWVTETFTWRYVFAGEVVVIAGVLAALRVIKDAPPVKPRPALDVVGAVLSASGMGLMVFGVLRIPQWGLIEPKGALTIAGTEITPLGFSAVPFLVAIGAVLMTAFLRWSERRVRAEREPLLRPDILRVGQLRGGLAMLGAQQLVMNGIFFVLPLYLQVVLGKDALETGLAILPISVTMFIAALGGPRLATRLSPRTIVQIGLAGMLVSAVGLIATIDYEINETGFAIALAAFGVGVGLLASQLGNVIMSSVEQTRASEAGGLQGTAQNLGASLGTALIGAILLSGLATASATAIAERPDVPPQIQRQIVERTEQGLEFVPRADVEQAAGDAGLPADQATAVAEVYGDAQLDALKRALFGAAIFVLIGFWLTRRLPSAPLGGAPVRGDPAPVSA
ncbi:MAG TPA: MFS transporter [Thermoleophilaceae bacterium]|nr:MFS transporter [Thermoleophilaceae bacterium]